MAKTTVERAHTMWGKSREKKAARMYHTRNFAAGHVEPDEYYLSRVGLRGRKRWLLLCGLLSAYLIVIGHFVITCIVLSVLRFDATGPPYFIFNDDGSLEWPQGASIRDVWLNSTLEAYDNSSLTISGQNNQQVVFQSGNEIFSATDKGQLDSSQVSVAPSETAVNPLQSFAVSHSGQQLLFASSSLVDMDTVSSLNQLTATTGLTTATVRAPLDKDLTVQSSSGSVSMHGGNGVFFGGRQINISSAYNLKFAAEEGAIVIGGRDGVTLLGPPTTLSGSANYHVCACAASRRLFLVPSNSQRCETAQNIDSICGL